MGRSPGVSIGLLACVAALTGCWRSSGSTDEPGACASTADCRDGQTCSPQGLCECGPGLCMGADWECHAGDGVSDAYCGPAGQVCAPCPPGQACLERACVPEECTCAHEGVTCLDADTEKRCRLVTPGCGVLETVHCDLGCQEPYGCVEAPCDEQPCDPLVVECLGPSMEQRCERGDDGCYGLAPAAPCADNETCRRGIGCTQGSCDECTGERRACNAERTAVEECADADLDGCFELDPLADDCQAAGMVCDERSAECVPPCRNECTSGQVRCSGTLRQRCERGELGCLKWVTEEDCALSHTVCAASGESTMCACDDPCDPESAAYPRCGETIDDFGYTDCVDANLDGCFGEVWIDCLAAPLANADDCAGCAEGLGLTPCSDASCAYGQWECNEHGDAYRVCVPNVEAFCLMWSDWDTCAGLTCDPSARTPCPATT